MNPALRVALYLVLLASTAFFGHRFAQGYAARVQKAANRNAVDEAPAQPVESTNATAAVTPGDNAAAGTNTPAVANTNLAGTAEASTHDVAAAGTNTVAAPPAQAAKPAPAAADQPIGLFAAVALGSLIGIGLLVAHDVSHYVANRTHKALYNEEGGDFTDPVYDQAEQAWANGEHLEAIRMMREYLAENPREIHVAFRIAEIYEKDLANNLAAALEYEEILKAKLSGERWGWAAIHLCNLYNRMNQPDKAEALLQRIVADYGATAAARKARERLGLPEDAEVTTAGEVAEAPPAETSHLPPGFRPKKR